MTAAAPKLYCQSRALQSAILQRSDARPDFRPVLPRSKTRTRLVRPPRIAGSTYGRARRARWRSAGSFNGPRSQARTPTHAALKLCGPRYRTYPPREHHARSGGSRHPRMFSRFRSAAPTSYQSRRGVEAFRSARPVDGERSRPSLSRGRNAGRRAGHDHGACQSARARGRDRALLAAWDFAAPDSGGRVRRSKTKGAP